VNPQRRVPVLDTGSEVLLQSPAIIEYLDEVYPEPSLLPVDARSRAAVRAAASIIGCDIHPLNNLSVLNYLRGPLRLDKEEISAWYTHWITQGFEALESMIDPGPFAFGARPGIADIYIVPQIYNARRFRVEMEDYPRLMAVDEACAGLEAFRSAAPERQPDAA
jgi:maleylacetoacetate isomerase